MIEWLPCFFLKSMLEILVTMIAWSSIRKTRHRSYESENDHPIDQVDDNYTSVEKYLCRWEDDSDQSRHMALDSQGLIFSSSTFFRFLMQSSGYALQVIDRYLHWQNLDFDSALWFFPLIRRYLLMRCTRGSTFFSYSPLRERTSIGSYTCLPIWCNVCYYWLDLHIKSTTEKDPVKNEIE